MTHREKDTQQNETVKKIMAFDKMTLMRMAFIRMTLRRMTHRGMI